MEVKQYLYILKRWAWLLAIGLVFGLAAGWLWSMYETPIYQASTKMLVMRASDSQKSDFAYLDNKQLAQTFIYILKTQPVTSAASESLGYSISGGQISASQVNDTQVIVLTVEDVNPDHAAAIANTLVNVLIGQNDALQSSRYMTTEESLTAQILQVEVQINNLQSQIKNVATQNVQEQIVQAEEKLFSLQKELAGLDDEISRISFVGRRPDLVPTDLAARQSQVKTTLELYQTIYSNLVVLGKPSDGATTDRLAQLQKTFEIYQQIYLQLLDNLEQVRLARLQSTPSIVQIEKATAPGGPIRPQPIRNTLLGAAFGLILASAAAFFVEYLDDTLRSPADVENTLGLPVLGYISEMNAANEPQALFVAEHPRSPVAEAFRTLRSNIEFSGVDHPIKTILVTSSHPGEGKTTIASNLAAIFAQSGKRVVLVDADLRRPAVHRAVNIPNRAGLATLFHDSLKPQDVWKSWGNGNRMMRVITSGSPPPNPSELLGSEKMLHILADLRKSADIIIIDSPPVIVADGQILSALVDGVIMVLCPGKLPADEATSTLTQLKRSGANVIGVVFNRIPKNGRQHYGGYRYYAPNAYHSYYRHERTGQALPVIETASLSDLAVTRPVLISGGNGRNGSGTINHPN